MMQRSLFAGRRLALSTAVRLTGSSTNNVKSIKLNILGGGNMAEAIINALSRKEGQLMSDVRVYDLNTERLTYLQSTYNVTIGSGPEDGIQDADVVMLSVKPQNVTTVAKSLPQPPKGLLLSIVAGCTIDQLKTSFRTDKVVRSMPNTPAMILEGITVWTATKECTPELVDKARVLLKSIGEQIEVKDESYLDMATAVSGSGPAYVFLVMEAMVDAAVHLGFSRDIAVKLVVATIRGSASYAKESGETLTSLRNNVTSPGGTTASALYELERGGFRTVVADSIWAAYRRALELGGNNPNVGPGRNKFTDSPHNTPNSTAPPGSSSSGGGSGSRLK